MVQLCMGTLCPGEGLLDGDHAVLHSPRLGTERHEKEIRGLIADLQEFYNVLRD